MPAGKLDVCRMIRKHIIAAENQNHEARDIDKSAKQYLNENQFEETMTNYSRGKTWP